MAEIPTDNRHTSWLSAVARGSGPIYMRIVDALADARTSGTLQPGDRLLPQRDLAELLCVDLTTVTRAFTEARRLNLIEAAPGRGTFVTPGSAEEPIIDLSMNIPPVPLKLNLPALIRSSIEGILKRSSAEALLSYHPGAGSPAERAAASHWLADVGERLPVDRVLVGSGAQALLAAAIAVLTSTGEVVLADQWTYPGVILLAKTLGRRLVGVATDADGMLPDALEAQIKLHDARLIYLNPTLHNPTTITMPLLRRREIAAVAKRHGMMFLEDDPYSRLAYDSPPSFLEIAPTATVHVATLAKCISPFLRTAFLVAPEPDTAELIAGAVRGLTLMTAPLMSGLAAEWIRSGVAQDIVTGVRAEILARQKLAAALLPDISVLKEGSPHIWFTLHAGNTSTELAELALRRGFAISPAGEFALRAGSADAVRVALGAAPTRARLEEGLKNLAKIVASREQRPKAIV